MHKVCVILPTMLSLALLVNNGKPALAEPVTAADSHNLAQATTIPSSLTGQYLVQGQDADGVYIGVAWMRSNATGDKIEIHWSVDGPGTPGIEDYVGVGGINSEGNLEVTYVGTTNYATGTQTFVPMPNGILKSTFDYTTTEGQPATGTETLIPVRTIPMLSAP